MHGFIDTVWNNGDGHGDYALAGFAAGPNAGGLEASSALATAILLTLFSDARAPEGARLDSDDRRGWWGDSARAAGEPELGSRLWLLLERAAITPTLAAEVEAEALRALSPLVAQGAVSRFDVFAEVDRVAERLDLTVHAYSEGGARIYSQIFDLYWRETGAR